jgi:hypothetical protein
MSKPTHIAYVVADPKEGTDRKAKWREIGAVWPHKSGTGFDLVIYDQLSVSVKHVGAVSAERHPRDARYNFKLMGGWCGRSADRRIDLRLSLPNLSSRWRYCLPLGFTLA